MTVRFERVTDTEDIPGLMALDELCFNRPWTRADYERELADPDRCVIVVARDVSGTIVAYCSFWRVFDEAHINNLAVHPAWRRQGLGRRLLAQALATGTGLGAPRATLEVRMSNEAALALYRSAGFSLRGVRRAYYTHPVEDALILWREPTAPPVGS